MSKEKHDALYSSARVVLNSNVKRLWFNVNPFLEKKPTLTATPEPPSKFIQPLQSTLVCEKYLQDCSCGNIDIQIDDFWEFLSAGDFSGGYSVRVLEGQLLEYLMTSLVILKRSGEIIDHKTFAFARNERERRGCYKLANQRGCGIIKETLLVEFTYYGRSKKKLEVHTSEWSSYPETLSTTTTSDFLSMQSSKFDSEDEVTPYQSIGSNKIVTKKISREQLRSSTTSSKLKHKRSDNSSHCSTDTEVSGPPPKLDLKKFSCTEKTPYPDAQEAASDDGDSTDDEYYGEEFYLSDLLKKGFEDGETVQDKLRKRRDELNLEREEEKKAVEEWTKRRTESHLNFKQFDADKDHDLPDFRLNYNFLTKVPTLEEFICILEEFEKFDPRFKKQKQLNKKVAMQYKLQKENEKETKEKDNIFGRTHMVTAAQKASFFSLGIMKKKPKPSETKLPQLDKLKSKRKLSVFGKSGNSPTDDRLSPLGKNALLPLAEDCPECMARIVLGITDSKPCEQHTIEHMPKSKHPMADAAKGRRQSITRRRQSTAISTFTSSKIEMPSIYVQTPSGTTTCIHDQIVHGRRSKPSNKSSKSNKTAQTVLATAPEEKPDSFSTDAEPEENKNIIVVESTPSLFDTNKLNYRYSFEKLRGKGYHKKKPAFYKVLKKYYRMHTAVTVFNEPVTRKGKRMSILQQIIDQKTANRMLPKRKPKMQIGKLRKFSFQDKEIQRSPHEESPEFKHIDVEKFRESFLKALDEFVVRKELVISSHGSAVSTTITFTKRSIFLRSQD